MGQLNLTGFGPLDIDDVLSADELMLSNSGWGLLPVVGVEREELTGGTPGPVYQALRKGFEALLDRETRFGLGTDQEETL